MKPATPVIPGLKLTVTTFANDQPEYPQLPAFRDENGVVLTRWRLTWGERFRILLSGNLWLTVRTFGRPLQPVKLSAGPSELIVRDLCR
jgi:hypothetical protein